MPSKVFGDDDGDFPQSKGPVELEVDQEYIRRLQFRRERDDSRRYAAAVAEGQIVENEDESEESDDASDPEEEIGVGEVSEWMESLVKLKKHDPGFRATGQIEAVEKKDRKKKKKKKKKMYLKDVQAQQLLEEGPDAAEEDEGRRKKVQTYDEQHEEMRQAVADAVEAGGEESDAEDLLKVKEGDEDDEEEEVEEIKEMADEYFGKESELGEGDKFLREYLLKQMWKDKDGKSKTQVIDEAELDQISDDELLVIKQEEFETKYRHEEGAGGIVMSQSRIVEGSVRKKDNARKEQRTNRENRKKIAEIERQEELKRLKNVKKKEINEKMKKVLSIAGFKEGEEIPLAAQNLDDEFDPEEYDKMMKAAFDDKYYGAEDSEFHRDEDDDDDDDEKPDFDKEDELLGLPKNWDVIQSGDGFTATREKVLKENGYNDDEEPEEEEEEEEVDEEEEREGKRKRKRKASLVKRAKEALMEEYYKLDYEDTIGDLKTRFKFAKVQPNSYGLEKEEILFLDDKELNQYVPLKKMAPYMENDWEVNKYKFKEQKLKFSELLERIDNPEEKRSKKKSKKRDREEKKNVVEEKKPAAPIADEEGQAETSKLSRKAKRRRREAEKKLPPNRMVAYGKTN